MNGQTIVFRLAAEDTWVTLDVADYSGSSAVNLLDSTLDQYYSDRFSIAIERLADDGIWYTKPSEVFSNTEAEQYATVRINDSTGTASFTQAFIDILNREGARVGSHEVGNNIESRIRVRITPAIAPVIPGMEFPAGNISVESLNAALRKRDLQDIFARQFALRGPQGDPGRRGWIPQLAVETYVPVGQTEARLLIKLDAWVGGEGDRPTEFVGQYLNNTGGFTADPAMGTDFRGIPGPQGFTGSTGDRGQVGYSPVFRAIPTGSSVVLLLSDWVLPPGQTAQGRLPAGVGQYLGPNGLTPDINAAINIRGDDGHDGFDGRDGVDGEHGNQGAQGRYAVRVYVALTEAERTVNGVVRTPNRPTATGYDPDNNLVLGLTSNPAWDTVFPAGDEIVADNKDVFESFATYDPRTARLSTFTTPFEISNERGPSGPAGRDGIDGVTPDIATATQEDHAPAEEASTSEFTGEQGARVHIDHFHKFEVSGNAVYVMPSAYNGTFSRLSGIPTSGAGNSDPRVSLPVIGALGIFGDAYDDRRTSQLALTRTVGGNTENITMHAVIQGDNLTFYTSHQDIADSPDIRMVLTVDGERYLSDVQDDTNNATVYSQRTGRSLSATHWDFGDNREDDRPSVARILQDGLYHRIDIAFEDRPSGTTFALSALRGAVPENTIEIDNPGTVLQVRQFIGARPGHTHDLGEGLYLRDNDVYTPFIERATAISGPKGDTGNTGATGEAGITRVRLYTTTAVGDNIPASPGTVTLETGNLDRHRTYTIGSTVWTNVPSARQPNQITWISEALVRTSRAVRGMLSVTFSSVMQFSGDKGDQGERGVPGPTGPAGNDGAGGEQVGRNFIINGGMTIDQREQSQSALFVAASEGTISRKWVKDRWSLALPWNDQGITVSTEKTNATRSRRALKLTAASGPRLVASRIPWAAGSSRNIPLFPTGAVTLSTTLSQEAAFKAGWGITGASALQLSFMFKSPTANTNYTIQLIDHSTGSGTRNKLVRFRSGATANTWERHTVSIGGRTTGDAVDVDNINNKGLEIQFRLFETEQYTEATGTAADGAWTGSAADLATLNDGEGYREVRFNPTDLAVGVDANGDFWEISDVQLEDNTAATEFELEDFNRTLERCRPYFTRERCTFQRVYSPSAYDALSEIIRHSGIGFRARNFVQFELDDSGYVVKADFTAPSGMRKEQPTVGYEGVAFGTSSSTNTNRATNNPFSFSSLIGGRIDALSLPSTGYMTLTTESDDDGFGQIQWGNNLGPLMDFDAEFDA